MALRRSRSFVLPQAWIVALALAAAASSARAQYPPTELISRWALSQGPVGSSVQSAGPLSSSHSSSYHPYDAAGGVGAESEFVNFGLLMASGNATGTATAQNGGGMHVGNFADTWIGAVAQWNDLLTINGPGPVSLLITDAFTGTSAFMGTGYPQFAFSSAFLSVSTNLTFQLDSSGTNSQVFTFSPGQHVSLQGFLSGGCNADVGNTSPPGPAVMQCSYAGTDIVSIDVLTSGGSYATESGTVYGTTLSAVPESAIWQLVLPGLAALGLVSRKRQTDATR